MRMVRIGCALHLLVCASSAQQYVISTFAGGAPQQTPVLATSASLGNPYGVATDQAGNVYVSSAPCSCVYMLDTKGVLNLVAGIGRTGYSGDGGPAVNAELNSLASNVRGLGIAVGPDASLYIADHLNNRVRKVSPDGIIVTVAGNGSAGFSGDKGPATAAQLNNPVEVAVDAGGNIYVADFFNNRVRRVSVSGVITTFAGNGTAGHAGDGGQAIAAQLSGPTAVTNDSMGNVYIADSDRVRKVSTDGTITTIAGGGSSKPTNGAVATAVQLGVYDVAVDGSGTLYIEASSVFKLIDGNLIIVAGADGSGFSGDNGPATEATFSGILHIALDTKGNLFIADFFNGRVRRVDGAGTITTVIGNGQYNYSGDQLPAQASQINYPRGVAVDSNGGVYIADTESSRIRMVSPNGVINNDSGKWADWAHW